MLNVYEPHTRGRGGECLIGTPFFRPKKSENKLWKLRYIRYRLR